MKRVTEIDFVKCVMILLMIAFHLVYIGDTYPDAKRFVYTFHMSCFLVISGYLLNMKKPTSAVVKSMLWIALPYAIMETGYIFGAAVLPIREHIDNLTAIGYLDRLILHPIGPYWYLQTLVICSIVCRLVEALYSKTDKAGVVTKLLSMGFVLWLMTLAGVVAVSSCMYFMVGVAMRSCNVAYERFFQKSWMGVIGFVLFAIFAKEPDRFTIAGIAITYLAVSVSLLLHDLTQRYTAKVHGLCLFIGRNTLLLLLFSPIFTILAKTYQPYLIALDASGIIFMIVSVAFAVAGSLAIGWVSDLLKVSPYVFGRQALGPLPTSPRGGDKKMTMRMEIANKTYLKIPPLGEGKQ